MSNTFDVDTFSNAFSYEKNPFITYTAGGAGIPIEGGDLTIINPSTDPETALLSLDRNGTTSAFYVYNDTPNGNVTGNPGDFVIANKATTAQLYQNVGTVANNDTWVKPYQIPDDIIIINTQAEWDSYVSGGIITITANTRFQLNTAISTSARIVVNPGAGLYIGGDNNLNSSINYTGSDTFITATNVSFIFLNKINTISNFANPLAPAKGSGTLFNIVGINGCLWQDVIFLAWGNMGSYTGGNVFDITNAFMYDCGQVFLEQINNHGFQRLLIVSGFFGGPSVNGPIFNIVGGNTPSSFLFSLCTVTLQAGESFISIEPNTLIPGDSVSITQTFFSGANTTLFDASVPNSGTFTAVTDASFSGVAVTVTDNGGWVQYNWTPGPTINLCQRITITGFATAAYNITNHKVLAVGAGFAIVAVVYAGDEAGGSMASNVLTISTPATGTLADCDDVLLDTDLATTYDLGSRVFNVVANTSFQVNGNPDGAATGTWAVQSLDYTSPNVIAAFNTFNPDSKRQFYAFVNGNATPVAGAGAPPVNLVFGTAGNAMMESSITQRFKLVNEINGIVEYTVNEPFTGFYTLHLEALGSGGADTYTFNLQVDKGVGYVNLIDNVITRMDVGSTLLSTEVTIPLRMELGWKVKPQLLTSTAAALTIVNASIAVS